MSELTGQVIGPYQITERLGRGGMADVYKAFHTELKVYRAIKFIRPEFVTSEDFRTRFQKEAQSVAGLRHPNIVTIHDFGTDGDRYYMVMEFVAGQDLKSLLRSRGAFDIPRSVAIVVAVADALRYAHQRDLVHRDIKPENIMLDTEGTPVLMDFGIAKLLTAETQLTQTGMGIGTPAYMAPEQAKGLEVGPAADIYSLAIVLFEMVTGQVPFSADTPMAVMLKAIGDPLPMPRSLNADISEALQGVILKATAKEPGDRYQSAAAFAADLKRAMSSDAPTVVRPAAQTSTAAAADTVVRASADTAPTEALPSAAQTEPPPSRKSRLPVFATGLLVLLLAAGGAYLFLGTGAEPVSDARSESAGEASAQTGAGPAAAASGAVVYALRDEIDANETITESVALKAGDVVYLNVHDTAATTDFTLSTSDGRERLFRSYSDGGPYSVPADGDYRFSIAMRGGKSGMVDVELLKLDPPVIAGGALTPGSFFAATTELPGQTVAYTTELAEGDTVYFDITRSAATTDFTLLAPDGRSEVFSSYSDSGPHPIKRTGGYTLTADPRGDKLGDFEANLYKLEPPVIDGGTLALNEFVAAETSTPGQVISYRVDLDAGSVLFFDVDATHTTDFTLAKGRRQVFSGYADSGPVTVEQSGEHILVADPRGSELSRFEATLYRLDPPVIDGGAVSLGQMVAGATQMPGQRAAYTIDLEGGTTVKLDVIRSSATADFMLTAPDGREVFSSYADTRGDVLGATGTYTLTVDPRGDRVAEFEFTLLADS